MRRYGGYDGHLAHPFEREETQMRKEGKSIAVVNPIDGPIGEGETPYNAFLAAMELSRVIPTEEKTCPGIDLGDGNFSGCDQSGGDCPTCGK